MPSNRYVFYVKSGPPYRFRRVFDDAFTPLTDKACYYKELRTKATMHIVKITYTVPLETVDKFLPAHVEWLHENEEAGRFLAYGRLVPRTGGIIVAKTKDRAELETIIASDPFKLNNVGTYEVFEFQENRSFAAKYGVK